jgi:hypothetical protein
MAGLAAANRARHRIGVSLAVAATFFLLMALPQMRAAAEDVLQEAINYVFTGVTAPANAPKIVDREACTVVIPDLRNKRFIRYYLGRFNMDDSRITKTYSGRLTIYTLEVDGDDVILEYLGPDETTVVRGYKSAQIVLPGDIDQTQKALRLLVADYCKRAKPKAPF